MNDNIASGVDRRTALGAIGAVGLIGAGGVSAAAGVAGVAILRPEEAGWDAAKGEYTLPALPYATNALEPHIDARTMEIHHDRHHKAYVDGANAALKELARIRDGQEKPVLVKFWSRELAFHASGHFNHSLFWQVMASPKSGGGAAPTGELAGAIDRDFGSFEKFVGHFKEAARQVEGSGWGWLVYQPMSGKLLVLQGEKQQDMTVWGAVPLMGVDVWEHAYYLQYQNKRPDYIAAFLNVVNWARVGEFYQRARGGK